MRRYEFAASAHSRAPVVTLWPLVAQATRWTEWSWMTHASLLREGNPPPDGLGALRKFGVGPGGSHEEVVAWEPPHHLGYVAVKGLPVRHYRADVHIEPDDDGTRVTWQCVVEPLVPGTGKLLSLVIGRMVRGFARRVCRYADSLTDGAAPGGH